MFVCDDCAGPCQCGALLRDAAAMSDRLGGRIRRKPMRPKRAAKESQPAPGGDTRK